MLGSRHPGTYVHEVVSQTSSRIRSALGVLDQTVELGVLLFIALVRGSLGLDIYQWLLLPRAKKTYAAGCDIVQKLGDTVQLAALLLAIIVVGMLLVLLLVSPRLLFKQVDIGHVRHRAGHRRWVDCQVHRSESGACFGPRSGRNFVPSSGPSFDPHSGRRSRPGSAQHSRPHSGHSFRHNSEKAHSGHAGCWASGHHLPGEASLQGCLGSSLIVSSGLQLADDKVNGDTYTTEDRAQEREVAQIASKRTLLYDD